MSNNKKLCYATLTVWMVLEHFKYAHLNQHLKNVNFPEYHAKKSGIHVLKPQNVHFFLFLKVIWRSRSNQRHLKSCMATMDILTNNYARDQTSSFTLSHLARKLFDLPSCWYWLQTECKMHKFMFFIFCYFSSWHRNNAYISMTF